MPQHPDPQPRSTLLLGLLLAALTGACSATEADLLRIFSGMDIEDERCDGRDNDRDGETDDELSAPLATLQTGVCAGAIQYCAGAAGWQEPDYAEIPEYEATETRCDGRDNDCDGQTDEELNAPLADRQTGVCAGAIQHCAGAAGWQEPDYAEIPEYEVTETRCDGLDNDCDGDTDEALRAPPADRQAGVCGGAIQHCAGAAGWQEPDYAEIPEYEVTETRCDGQDNDCDGQTDEELNAPLADRQTGVCAGAIQHCAGAAGWQEPDYAEIPEYEATETRCDGLDNDCDGQIDAGLAGCTHCDGNASVPCNGCPAGTVVPAGWACIPAGTWTLGSPAEEAGRWDDENQHEVELTYPFLMQRTEVTQAEWLTAMGSNPSDFRVGGNGGCREDPCEQRPVETVRWFEAVAYCNTRSVAEGLQPCYLDAGGAGYDAADAAAGVVPTWSVGLACPGYRLPTEAEWEIAARAGFATATPAGNLDANHLGCEQPNPILDGIAWFCGNSGGRTHPVGTRTANAWGFYDLLGNVWEWCWDWYGSSYPADSLVDPLGPPAGSNRVVRGGAWFAHARFARSAERSGSPPANRWTAPASAW